jgi:hypothetical protein
MGLLGKETEENITKIVTLLEWLKEFIQKNEITISVRGKDE